MRAMRYHGDGKGLRLEEVETPVPGPGQILVRVRACGVCRTDLHVIDDELEGGVTPIIPGHEIVGTVEKLGEGVSGFEPGQRIGIPWLGFTCGTCPPCSRGLENLCDAARFTGFHIHGGYAEYTVADARYCFALDALSESGMAGAASYSDADIAPLLCAGLIGHRSLEMAGDAERLGLYGFGAAAHIVAQLARARGQQVYAFTRAGDSQGQSFARELGAVWAGGSEERPPEELDAAILFAPVGSLVPAALRATGKGGRVVCAGIHMSDIPAFPYRILWQERSIHSVANLTRRDAEQFLALVPSIPIRTETTLFPLHEANEALDRLRRGALRGAAVLTVGE